MTAIPESEFTLILYDEDRTFRTGCLLYYDPILLCDLDSLTLGQMDTYSDTLPASDTTITSACGVMNAKIYHLQV